MSDPTRDALWARLREAALVEGEAPAPGEPAAPWYVRVMLGIAGWIGALFLLGFVGAAFAWVMENAVASFVLGVVTSGGAAVIFRSRPAGDFSGQFGLAVSLAGQAMMAWALSRWLPGALQGLALAIAVQQGVLFALVPNFIHRVWTAWSGAAASAYALADTGLEPFAPALVAAASIGAWLHEFDHPRQGRLLRAAGYGFALAAVQAAMLHAALWTLLEHGVRAPVGGATAVWLGNLAAGAVLVWVVLALLRREGVAPAAGPGCAALLGASALALLCLQAPGVGPATAILVVGFANGNRVLAGLGILALLAYLSHFYYALQATLLVKSAVLACTGLALLAARLALHRWAAPQEEEHA